MFRFTPRDMIRDLRHLLGDRYRHDAGGLSLIKEVVQNADDARAEKLVLAWCEGESVPSGTNPLFGRPGILIVNDAPFEEGHERAFTSFSNSSKDSEVAQIGRFGIGRKSLFHWAEVICYLGRGADGRQRGGVLDPWAELRTDATWHDHRFPAWTRWSEVEANVLRRKVGAALRTQHKTWFGVWLPARDATDERYIVDTNTTLETLPTTDEALSRVARLMPQLASLREIEVVRVGLDGELLGRLTRGGETLGRPIRPIARTLQKGHVDGASRVVDYVCSEEHRSLAALENLKTKKGWPEEPPEDFDDPSSKPTPAKAEPHGAVTVVWGPESPGSHRLSLSAAIFLPLSGARLSEEQALSANRSVDIYLHGYLFPDSGRQDIEGLHGDAEEDDQTTAGIRRAWNRTLWRQVTLPQVPFAIEGALRGQEPTLIDQMLSALQATRFWGTERQHVLTHAQLVSGPSRATPYVVDANRRVLRLPRPSSEEVASVLTRAAVDMDGCELAWVDQGGLLRSDASEPWGRNEVLMLIRGLEPAIERAPLVWLPWLVAWLGGRFEPSATPSLAGLVLLLWRAAMRGGDWAEKLKHPGWAALAEVGRRSGLAVLFVDTDVLAMSRELRHADAPLFEGWPVMLLAAGDEKRESGTLAPEVAMAALEAAAERIGEATPDPKVTVFIAVVLAATSLAELKECPGFGRLRVLKVWSSLGSRDESLVSLERMEALSSRGLVFHRGGLLQPWIVAKALSDALAGPAEVMLVKEDVIAEALGLSKLGLDTLAAAVSKNKIGNDLDARLKLLDRMLTPRSGSAIDPSQASTEVVHAVRRLLAGDAAPASPLSTLWTVGETPVSVVSALFPESWQALEQQVETFVRRKLSEDWRDRLGLRTLDLSKVCEELTRHLQAGTIPAVYARLGHAGRPELADYTATLTSLWPLLEVHKDQRSGEWTALDRQTCFIDTGLSIPSAVKRQIRLIRRRGVAAYDDALDRTIDPFDAARLIELGLDEQSWVVVVEGLLRAGGGPGEHILQRFRETPWLPLEDGTLVAPAKVLSLPRRLADATARLPHGPPGLWLAHQLSSDLMTHASWPAVQLHLLSGNHAIQCLLDDMVRLSDAQKVDLRYFGEGAEVPDVLKDHLASDAVFDWWAALAAEGFTPFVESWGLVRGAMSQPRARALLEVTQRVRTGEKLQRADLKWFAHILRHLPEQGAVASDHLVGCLLPDAEYRLQSTSLLARGTEALPSHHRVHPDLEDFFEIAPIEDEGLTEAADRTTLEDWLSPWDDARTSQSLLAYFVAIFACNPGNGLDSLLRRLAPQDSAEGLVRNLTKECQDVDGGEISRAKRTGFRFVRVRPGCRYSVIALDFSVFETSYNQGTSLFVDPMDLPRVAGRDGEASRVIRLRELEPSLEAPERHRLLAGAIVALVQSVLGRRPKATLHRLLEQEAQELNQLVVAQNLLIDTLPFALRLLGTHKLHVGLKTRLDAIDSARHQLETKRNQLKDSRFRQELRASEDALDEARRELRRLIEDDAEVAVLVLTALRNKLTEYQYQPEQVLFELAQNADDAYAQRRISGEAISGALIEVVVREQPAAVVFRHRGRPINRCYVESDREKGWERDLINMLGLGFSEKGEGETGRFGLGFKSVYLVTDRPLVRSENAAFEIGAGVLPFSTSVDNEGWTGGTEFALPLRDEVRWHTIVERFARLCGFLPVLAQDIEQVVLETPGGGRQVFGERPHVIAEDPDVEVELVRIDVPKPLPAHGFRSSNADCSGPWIFFRALSDRESATGPRVAMGFKVGSSGFEVMNGVPSHWITVPTRETHQLGFIVAGPFGIDVGRSRLATESESTHSVEEKLARMARAALGLFETSVLDAVEGPGQILGADPRLSDSAVASSLFSLLTKPFDHKQNTKEQELVRRVLREPMLDWVALLPDIDGYRRRFKDIELVLDSDLTVRAVRVAMREHFGLRGVAIGGELKSLLAKLGYFPKVQSLSVVGLVEKVLPEGSRLSVDGAEKLLALKDVQSELPDPRTWQKLEEHVKTLTVPNHANGRVAIGEVLLGIGREGVSGEELLVSAFAPPERVLHDDVAELLQDCILTYRRTPKIIRSDLLAWAEKASTPTQQIGVAAYLYKGAHHHYLREGLEALMPTWLKPDLLDKAGAALGVDEKQRDALGVAVHGLKETSQFRDSRSRSKPEEEPSPTLTLTEVMRWWAREKSSAEVEYQRSVYPGRWSDRVELTRALRDGQAHAWGTLFALAICQRIGRVRPQQNRNFIANHKAWVDVLATRTSTAEQWMQLIDDWAIRNWTVEEYSHWLGLFPSLRRIWHSMDTLIELLRTPPPGGTSSSTLASFATNPALSGSGLRLPNLSRGFGKKGSVWLTRELVRLEVWPLSSGMDYYVPWKLACKVVLGQESGSEAELARVLRTKSGQEAPFGRCFDLPFDILRHDKSTRASLIGTESDDDEWTLDSDEWGDS